jgi:hypothetical protein
VVLEEVMKACSWRAHDTFTSHYLKDLALTNPKGFDYNCSEGHQLRPIWKVEQGSCNLSHFFGTIIPVLLPLWPIGTECDSPAFLLMLGMLSDLVEPRKCIVGHTQLVTGSGSDTTGRLPSRNG